MCTSVHVFMPTSVHVFMPTSTYIHVLVDQVFRSQLCMYSCLCPCMYLLYLWRAVPPGPEHNAARRWSLSRSPALSSYAAQRKQYKNTHRLNRESFTTSRFTISCCTYSSVITADTPLWLVDLTTAQPKYHA